MTSVPRPSWPRHVITIAPSSVMMTRGTSSEFRFEGISLTQVPTAAEAIARIRREPSIAAVLTTPASPDMPLGALRDAADAAGGIPVILGVGLGEQVADIDAETLLTVVIPVTPQRLADALRAVPRSEPAPLLHEQVGQLELDLDAVRVWWHGREVRLPPRAFEILHCLAVAAPEPVDIDELVRTFVPPDTHWRADSIRFAMRRIRELFEAAAPGIPAPIETVVGVGYRITEPPVRAGAER